MIPLLLIAHSNKNKNEHELYCFEIYIFFPSSVWLFMRIYMIFKDKGIHYFLRFHTFWYQILNTLPLNLCEDYKLFTKFMIYFSEFSLIQRCSYQGPQILRRSLNKCTYMVFLFATSSWYTLCQNSIYDSLF